LATKSGELIGRHGEFRVRCLEFLSGTVCDEIGYLDERLMARIGQISGELVTKLVAFDQDHPGLTRVLEWDNRQAEKVVSRCLPAVACPARRARVGQLFGRAWQAVQAASGSLRVGLIHGDLAYYNLIANREESRGGLVGITGVIDFGDCQRSWVVGDVATAVAALLARCPEWGSALEVCARVLRGFHGVAPLTAAEVSALWPLVVVRACVLATMIEFQLREDPGNAYMVEEAESDRHIFDVVEAVPFALAEEYLLQAVGLGPSHAAQAAARWVQGPHPAAMLPSLATPGAEPRVLDLGVASKLLQGGQWRDPRALRSLVASAQAQAPAAVGAYSEARLMYTAPDQPEETATVHLGLDVFLPAGAAVHAPVEGTIRAVTAATGEVIFSAGPVDIRLAGVTSAAPAGTHVKPGQLLATVAEPPATSLLPAHLHLQVVAIPGLQAPGLTTSSSAAAWLSLCPDPTALLVGGSTANPILIKTITQANSQARASKSVH
jgi:Ser/Thr protein kinase RdoA (MazF antagonist)